MSKHYLARHFRKRFNGIAERRLAAFKTWLKGDWTPFTAREINFLSRYVRMFTK